MTTIRKTSPAKASAGRSAVSKTATKTVTAKAVKQSTAKKTPAKTSASKKSTTQPTVQTAAVETSTPRSSEGNGVEPIVVDRANDPPPETGLALIDRVRRSIEREIIRIEAIVGGDHGDAEQRTEAERCARTLASLTKTLVELRRLRADDELQRPADDDAIPRDLDELRRALSQRLEQLVADPAQPAAAGDE